LPVAYPVNGAELAKRLRVNAKSLRSLIRLHNLVPGHLKHKEYRIFQDAETVIWHHVDVQALSRR
jgi:DNA-binding transcriptional MerR regulator